MDFGKGFGDQMNGIVRLAIVGAILINVVFLALIFGAGAAAWWTWNNVEVRIVEQEEGHR